MNFLGNITSEYLEHLATLALDKWGNDVQITVVIEELGELITALAKYKNGRVNNVTEEFADVIIMLHQLYLIIQPENLDDVVFEKLLKLEKHLNK